MVTLREVTPKLSSLTIDDDAILKEVFEVVDTGLEDPMVTGLKEAPKALEDGG